MFILPLRTRIRTMERRFNDTDFRALQNTIRRRHARILNLSSSDTRLHEAKRNADR